LPAAGGIAPVSQQGGDHALEPDDTRKAPSNHAVRVDAPMWQRNRPVGRLVDVGDAKRRAAARRAERGLTRSWLFNYRPGDLLRANDGSLYAITEVPPADRNDLTVMVQRLVLDEQKKPIAGLREGRPFPGVAARDGVRLSQGRWARRVPAETA